MKTRIFLSFLALVILGISPYSLADHLQCALQLYPISGTLSSESKDLFFEGEFSATGNRLYGTLVTTSCFGSNTENFQSLQSKMKIVTTGDEVTGVFSDAALPIGAHHYWIMIRFTQMVKSPTDVNEIVFLATGKILSDQEDFIHRDVTGECSLSRSP